MIARLIERFGGLALLVLLACIAWAVVTSDAVPLVVTAVLSLLFSSTPEPRR